MNLVKVRKSYNLFMYRDKIIKADENKYFVSNLFFPKDHSELKYILRDLVDWKTNLWEIIDMLDLII